MAYTVGLVVVALIASSRPGPTSYFGLDKGLAVTYQYSESRGGGPETLATFKITNLAPRELNGLRVVPRQVEGEGKSLLVFMASDADGLYTAATQISTGAEPQLVQVRNYILKFPLEVGTSWITESRDSSRPSEIPVQLSNTIAKVNESVTVPAGTFDDCLKVEAKGESTGRDRQGINHFASVAETVWYCPGLGAVKATTQEAQTAGNSTSTRIKTSQLMSVVREDKAE